MLRDRYHDDNIPGGLLYYMKAGHMQGLPAEPHEIRGEREGGRGREGEREGREGERGVGEREGREGERGVGERGVGEREEREGERGEGRRERE